MIKNSKFIIDKSVLLHFGACLLITFIIGVITWLCGSSIVPASIGSALGAFCCGIVKEWMDSNNKNNYWNWGDILGNFIGCIIGIGVLHYAMD